MKVGRWTLLLPAALLVACSAGPSTRPAVVVNDGDAPAPSINDPGPAPVPPLDEPTKPNVRWSACGPEMTDRLTPPPAWLKVECGRANGVLDSPYAPGRGTVRMQLLKAGTGPIPIVVVNDIDGMPGSLYAARLAATLPQDFFTRFSLIGLDRRGTGNTDAVRCVPQDVRSAIVDVDPREADAERWVDAARTAGQQCAIELETRLPALDTARTAADLESVRAALGSPRLNAIGHGEGSRVVAVYAERNPDKTGRLVLDGVPDPNQDALAVWEGVAKGAEATFTAFATDCGARGCELGSSANQALAEVLSRSASAPLTGKDGTVLNAGVVLRAVLAGLGDRQTWPVLSKAIADARSGVPDGLIALAAPIVHDGEELPATFDSVLVTRCNDTTTRVAAEQLTTTAKEWNKRYPLFGGLMAQWPAVCGPWPVPAQPLPRPTAAKAPPIVVLSTATDPVTPQPGTESAAQQLATSVLVSWQGAGHGALGVSACATDAARAFLADGKVPRDKTVCPP